MSDLFKIGQTKSKYEIMYVPIGDMKNVVKNNTYLYDYGHDTIYETKMESSNCKFNILHFYESCHYEPSNVTYIIYCPCCSKYGQNSITSSYLRTNYSKLRFYLTHSDYNCPVIKQKKRNISANLLCDQCKEPL